MVTFQWQNIFRKKTKQKTLRESLKDNVLFQDLTPIELRLVENIVHLRQYRPGEIIFRQGEVGVGMYIVVSGIINIHVEEIEPSTMEAKTTHITQLKNGDFFGELALVEHEGRRSASATAQEECVLVGFYKPDLIEIVERNASAGVKILMRLGEVLGYRLRQTTSKITEMKKEAKYSHDHQS